MGVYKELYKSWLSGCIKGIYSSTNLSYDMFLTVKINKDPSSPPENKCLPSELSLIFVMAPLWT